MARAEPLSRSQLEFLLVSRIRLILEPQLASIGPATRFGEDLHADSLDLVEILESTEAELRRRGLQARLPDAEVAAIRTVGDALERITDQLVSAAPSNPSAGAPPPR